MAIITKVGSEDWIDPAERLDEAQRRYSRTPKGKAALKKAQGNYWKRRVENRPLAQACSEYLEQNPGKTVEDFLEEYAVD